MSRYCFLLCRTRRCSLGHGALLSQLRQPGALGGVALFEALRETRGLEDVVGVEEEVEACAAEEDLDVVAILLVARLSLHGIRIGVVLKGDEVPPAPEVAARLVEREDEIPNSLDAARRGRVRVDELRKGFDEMFRECQVRGFRRDADAALDFAATFVLREGHCSVAAAAQSRSLTFSVDGRRRRRLVVVVAGTTCTCVVLLRDVLAGGEAARVRVD
mmetsp:Transcript_22849/g.70211  ORF Transcript_22849/g.70211 Transcript_22849/m.70211 type:complete len:217 (+) Transcript_22849:942-1592(+)